MGMGRERTDLREEGRVLTERLAMTLEDLDSLLLGPGDLGL